MCTPSKVRESMELVKKFMAEQCSNPIEEMAKNMKKRCKKDKKNIQKKWKR
jgi:hypothetical protein